MIRGVKVDEVESSEFGFGFEVVEVEALVDEEGSKSSGSYHDT